MTNPLIAKERSVTAPWAQVENQYQRKIKLIVLDWKAVAIIAAVLIGVGILTRGRSFLWIGSLISLYRRGASAADVPAGAVPVASSDPPFHEEPVNLVPSQVSAQ